MIAQTRPLLTKNLSPTAATSLIHINVTTRLAALMRLGLFGQRCVKMSFSTNVITQIPKRVPLGVVVVQT